MEDTRPVKSFAASLGLDCTGIAPAAFSMPTRPAGELCPLAAGSGAERYEPARLLPDCRAVIVVLFPYGYRRDGTSNIALYCRSLDYHAIVLSYLRQICAYLERTYPNSRQQCIVDTSPLADRWLAYEAGLGFFGDNHCFINDRYGSYCFIGSILTTVPFAADRPLNRQCLHCGACRRACPGQCFQTGSYDYRRCKSYLTQKKGSFTLPEIEIMKKTPLIFGCDVCQDVCPHNAEAAETTLPEFCRNRLNVLCRSDIDTLSNRQFQQRFGQRAFAWRGKKLLLRNLDCLTLPASCLLENRGEGNGNI